MDLLSYAGGPRENSKLDEIRIYRPPRDTVTGKPSILRMDYDDLLFDERIGSERKFNPLLLSGDVVLLLQERRYTFRENVNFYLPIISGIITIVTLVVTLTRR
jgi:hypothetical protein